MKNKVNPNKQSLNAADKMFYLAIIASNKAEYEKELATKDDIIQYYKRAAEQATRSKHRALDRKEEHRKDMIVLALLIVGIAIAILIGGLAFHEFLLWASGR